MAEQDGKAETLLRFATHEAGHVVARWALKRTHPRLVPPLGYVDISWDEGGGKCYADRCQSLEELKPKECSRSVRRRLRTDIVIVMAGPIAEALHGGHPRLDNWCHWICEEHAPAHTSAAELVASDWWNVQFRISLLGQRWRGHLARAFDQADRIVREHQRHVCTLAKALIEHGRIEGDEAFAMLDAVGKPPLSPLTRQETASQQR
jgi:hypothetical protein